MEQITILTPTGTLGYGFDPDAFARGMTFRPAAIAVDAGSTDPGPYYLATGKPLAPRIAVEGELEQLLTAALSTHIPLIVGSCGGSGSSTHVAWTANIVRDLARKHGWHFKMATIQAEFSKDFVRSALRAGKIVNFESEKQLTDDDIQKSNIIVAQMGPEPIIAALKSGAQVILAGRACDDAVIAAMPILEGFDPGPSLHMGKILECGAFCSVPFAMDVIVGRLDATGFILEPGSLTRRCTIVSVAGHSLYERENPFMQRGPGGRVEMGATQFEQLDDRRVRVTGTRYESETPYRLKLEGTRQIGFRSVCVAGVRCPTMIERMDQILSDIRGKMQAKFGDASEFTLLFHSYGKNGVMGSLEKLHNSLPYELGLVTEVIAPTQEVATGLCHVATGMLLHHSYDGQKNNAGNLAFLYSPSEIDAGPAYVFSIYHLVEVDYRPELFPITMENV